MTGVIMRPQEDPFILCLVHMDRATGDPLGIAESVSAQSVRKLVLSELTEEDLEDLGFAARSTGLPTGGAPPDGDEQNASRTSGMIEATMRVIADQVGNLDLEAEMLALRKRALKRRLRILERLSKSLRTENDNRESE